MNTRLGIAHERGMLGHFHIVTSRVGPAGNKINGHHERVRSQEVINRIMARIRSVKPPMP